MYHRTLCAVLFLIVASQSPREADAVIIYGYGDDLIELGELPADVADHVAEELGKEVTVAYYYEAVHLFFADMWRWNGRYVLHAGDEYWVPEQEFWLETVGEAPASKYGTPWQYRFPPGLMIAAALIAGCLVRRRFFKTDAEQITDLLTLPHYQQAIEIAMGTDCREEPEHESPGKLVLSVREERLSQAADFLFEHGVNRHAAEANIRKIADAVIADWNHYVDEQLKLAKTLEGIGELEDSADELRQLIAILPEEDERFVLANQQLKSLSERIAQPGTNA